MLKDLLVIFLLLLLIIILVISDFGTQGKVYDCSMADIHPDYPSEVREECRRLRYENYKNQREEQKARNLV